MRSTVTLGKINLSTAQVRESVALTTPKICIFTLKERPDIHCGVSRKLCSSWGNIVRFFWFWLCLASITVQKSCQICPTLQVAYYCKSYFWHRDKWDFFLLSVSKNVDVMRMKETWTISLISQSSQVVFEQITADGADCFAHILKRETWMNGKIKHAFCKQRK